MCDTSFPNQFVVVAHKDVVIKEMWSPNDPHFLRPFNDWELEEVKNILTFLSRTKVQPSLEDKVRWVEEKKRAFLCQIHV